MTFRDELPRFFIRYDADLRDETSPVELLEFEEFGAAQKAYNALADVLPEWERIELHDRDQDNTHLFGCNGGGHSAGATVLQPITVDESPEQWYQNTATGERFKARAAFVEQLNTATMIRYASAAWTSPGLWKPVPAN